MLRIVFFMVVCLTAWSAQEKPERTIRTVRGKVYNLVPRIEWEKLAARLGSNSPQLPPKPLPEWEPINGRFEKRVHGGWVFLRQDKPTNEMILVLNVNQDSKLEPSGYFWAMRLPEVREVGDTYKIKVRVYDHGY